MLNTHASSDYVICASTDKYVDVDEILLPLLFFTATAASAAAYFFLG